MARLRYNGIGDPTGSSNAITVSSATATSCTWASSPGFPSSIAAPDYAVLVLEPNTSSEEVVWLVGWVLGSTSGSIMRKPPEGNYGTPAAHSSKPWVHGPTQADYRFPALRNYAIQTFT
jgi:hypothetical protein